ncbi:hypothetical protein T484DRAFT_1740833 [Baffinella frigidus]|nr:hypothetical protein T484DRAFT_1740833 [Cryptophyta sp. CCMP2293]
MSNTAAEGAGNSRRRLSELDRCLLALDVRGDGNSPGCHSPFPYSEEEDDPDGSTLQSEYEGRLGTPTSALSSTASGLWGPAPSKASASLPDSTSPHFNVWSWAKVVRIAHRRVARAAGTAKRVADGSTLQSEYERRLGTNTPTTALQFLSPRTSTNSAALSQSAAAIVSFRRAPPRLVSQSSLAEIDPLQANNRSWAKVVVSPFPQFRVQGADEQWLRLLGFNSNDVQNKSLRIAAGPKTKMNLLSQLCSSATATPSPPEWVTLYAKSGEEMWVVVRAKRENDDGHILLEMQSLSAAAGSDAPGASPAAVERRCSLEPSWAPDTIARANSSQAP